MARIGEAVNEGRGVSPIRRGGDQEALGIELARKDVSFEEERKLAIEYKGEPLKKKYRADFIIDRSVILEIEAASTLSRFHESKTIHYLKAAKEYEVGLLINFGAPKLEWKRYVV